MFHGQPEQFVNTELQASVKEEQEQKQKKKNTQKLNKQDRIP